MRDFSIYTQAEERWSEAATSSREQRLLKLLEQPRGRRAEGLLGIFHRARWSLAVRRVAGRRPISALAPLPRE